MVVVSAAVVAHSSIEFRHLLLHRFQRQVCQLRRVLGLGVQVVDISGMVAAVVDVHRGFVDVWL